MVSVGQSGTLGSEWAIQNSRRNRMESIYHQQIDLYSNLILNGVDTGAVISDIEMDIEGIPKKGEDVDLLSWDNSTWNFDTPDDKVFIDSSQKFFTNIDLDAGTYKIMDEQTFTENLGFDWSNGKPYDVFDQKFNTIDFYDFIFAGEDDGRQNNYDIKLSDFNNAKWGAGTYTIREVDTDLLDPNTQPTDRETALAKDTLDIMKRTMSQWATPKIQEMLSKYEEGSAEYNKLFNAIVTQLFDNEGYKKGNELDDPGKKYLEDSDPTNHSNWTPDPKNSNVKSCQIGDYKVISDGENYGFTDKDGNYYSFPASSIDPNKSLTENIKDLLSHTVIRNGQQCDVSKTIDKNGIEWTEYTPSGNIWKYDSNTGLSTSLISGSAVGRPTEKFATINGLEVKSTTPVLPNAQTTYTVTLKDGSTVSITAEQLEKSGQKLTDYVKSVAGKSNNVQWTADAKNKDIKSATVGDYNVITDGSYYGVTDKDGNYYTFKAKQFDSSKTLEDNIKELLKTNVYHNGQQCTMSKSTDKNGIEWTSYEPVESSWKYDSDTGMSLMFSSAKALGRPTEKFATIAGLNVKASTPVLPNADTTYTVTLKDGSTVSVTASELEKSGQKLQDFVKNASAEKPGFVDPEIKFSEITIPTTKIETKEYNVGDYKVTEKSGSVRGQVTVTDKNGTILGTAYLDDLQKKNMSVEDYVNSITLKSTGSLMEEKTHDDVKTYKYGDYTVTEKGGSTRPTVTVTDKNGQVIATVFKDELQKKNMSVSDYLKTLN